MNWKSSSTLRITAATPDAARFKGKIHPYAAAADPLLFQTMMTEAKRLELRHGAGITVSSSGFFANQGRDISEIPLTVPDIDAVLAKIESFRGVAIENMEMEASFLLHFMNALGHRAAAVSIAIANRRLDTFDHDYVANMSACLSLCLHTLANVRQRQS